jgi:SAM-dependent methyltransferase
MSVLDLGCGTGEDAIHLARRGVTVHALDASSAMVDAARDKAARAGIAGLVTLEKRPVEELFALGSGTRFDGAYSNFGALNCVEDLPAVGRALASLLRPGAPLLVCLLGRRVPWEWAWFLARGEVRRAFRRLSRRGAPWRGLTVRYPSLAEAVRAFSPAFVRRRAVAVGAFLPPTYAAASLERRPRLLATLDGAGRRLEGAWPLFHLSDHDLLRFERRG